MRDAGRHTVRSACIGALFVVGISLPLLNSWLDFAPELPNFEKRELAERPELELERDSLAAFPRRYEAWYDDHFGLRSRLIRWYNEFEARLLATSPNDEVLIGRDGWLYFAGQLNIEQYRAVTPIPREILDGWRRYLEMVSEWAGDRGSDFLLVVGPSKPTIHPEHLPATVRRVGETTRLDRFLEHMRDSRVRVLDLRPALLEAKRRHPVYQKTDTHWNSWGSLVAVRAIVDELRRSERFADLPPIELDDYVERTEVYRGGDIAELMGLTDLYLDEDRVWELRREVPYDWTTEGLPPGLHPHHLPYAAEQDPAGLPGGGHDALVLHDSFGEYFGPFLPIAFRRCVFYWQYEPPPAALAQEEPDLLLQEVGERVLVRDELKGGDVPFPLDPRIRRDFVARRAFRASRRELGALEPGPLALPATLRLPTLAAPGDDGLALLRIDVRSPVACQVSVEGAPQGRTLLAGRDVAYLVLPSPPSEGTLSLRWDPAAGTPPAGAGVRLLSAEVRAVPRGALGEGGSAAAGGSR